jgi:CitMHS family citrate-Mg2+:H+ or citrate-Ca2+:H+ symporter
MLIVLGYSMVAVFMILIMTRRLSALVALVLVPLVFGFLTGHGADLGTSAVDGIVKLAPTAALLLFAVLYFGVMIDAGLFDPLVSRVVRFAGGDPLRVVLGTTVIALVVSLDGDGTTTALVTTTACLPIYRRLGMNPLIIGVLLGSANSIVNLAPWGGPTGRVAAALRVDVSEVFVPLLPTIAIGMGATLVIAWHFGRVERRRLGVTHIDTSLLASPFERDEGIARPRLFPLNLFLTIAVLVAAVLRIVPLALLFMIALALALVINYPDLNEQRRRLASHAPNALPIVLLILAAGVFTGIMAGTGMIDAMAKGALAVMPRQLGPWMAPITALLSAPLTFVLSNDAYYFGVVPVIARTAAEYGVPMTEIARASLLGAPVHALSPLVAAVYLVSGLLDREVGELQRFGLKWACVLTFILIFAALATRAII